jgi:hypothetical protein
MQQATTISTAVLRRSNAYMLLSAPNLVLFSGDSLGLIASVVSRFPTAYPACLSYFIAKRFTWTINASLLLLPFESGEDDAKASSN